MARKAKVKATPTWSVDPLPAQAATSYINSVDISGDGQRVICGSFYYDYNPTANHTPAATTYPVGVFCYNVKGKLQWSDKFSASEGVYWVSMSHDATWAASGGLLAHGSGFIRAYNAATGAIALNFTTNARVSRVAISANGAYLVAGGGATYFFTRVGTVWSAPQVIPCATGDSVVSVDISDDGQWITFATFLGFVSLARNVGGILRAPVTWQQVNGTIHWVQMAAGGSGFVAGASGGSVFYFSTSAFVPDAGPTWTQKLIGCTRCASVGISADAALISAVGNDGKKGKVFLLQNQTTKAKSLWNAATLHNPNSTSLDSAGKFVTVADGYPDNSAGAFYLFDAAGNLNWTYATSNMSWPMQVSENASGIAAGSDDAKVYYFSV